MSAQVYRIAARGFAESNLSELAADVVAWRKIATLPNDRKLHELARLCTPFASDGDEYQEAERLIVQFALERIAADAKPPVTDAQRKEAFEAGAASARVALASSNDPLMMMDELCDDELSTAQAMGWNSVWASEENRQRWAEHGAKS